MPDAGSISVD